MKPGKQNNSQSVVSIQPVSVISSAKHIVPTQVVTYPMQKLSVKLHNLYTDRVVTIGHKAATLLATKYPDEYKLLTS